MRRDQWILLGGFALLVIALVVAWQFLGGGIPSLEAPGDPTAHYEAGKAASDQGDLNTAIAELEKAVQLKPDYAEAYHALGVAYTRLGISLAQQNQLQEATEAYSKAVAAYQKVIELEPDRANSYINLGNVYIQAGQLDLAIAALRKAVELVPDDPDAHYNLGAAYQFNEQYDEAIAQFQRVLEIDPNYANAYLGLGYAYKDKGMKDEAIQAFETFLKLGQDPEFRRQAEEQLVLLKGS